MTARDGRSEARGRRHSGVRRRSRQALLRGLGVAARRRFHRSATDWRVVQLTPPGSPCSIHLRQGNHDGRAGLSPGNSVSSSSDIEAARAELVGRGVDVSEVFHFSPVRDRAPCRARTPNGRSYGSFASFSDPDGNSWLLQEIKTRLPGRGLSNLDVATLTELLREAEKRHGEYEADRSEAPLVGLVRRLHRRARAGEDSRGGGQGWRAPHGEYAPMRADIVPGAVFPDHGTFRGFIVVSSSLP